MDSIHQQIEEQMTAAGLPPLARKAFHYYYELLRAGSTGLIHDEELSPLEPLPDADKLDDSLAEQGRWALSRTVVLKLNGGLGTSMGLARAKSLLPVKGDLTFLDIIARQALSLRERTGSRLPLLLMNSFVTEHDTLAHLERYPDLKTDLPLAFTQNQVPKILVEGLEPVNPAEAGDAAWCPPGHGDLYVALQTTGLLTQLLDAGCEYLFSSNSDNLGATLDERVLGYFARRRLPFLMEVADRTPADRKGGHLARHRDGRLILRERAQCPPGSEALFEDIDRYRYFNTNTIWIHLPSLQVALEEHKGVLKLPLIRNQKTLNPRDPSSPPVYQLETAMGSAIELFEGAAAIRVPRNRFAPVKVCADLLVLWSDAYRLEPSGHVTLDPQSQVPRVKLDDRYYRFIDQLRERFPAGAPSLRECEELHIKGDVRFGEGVKVIGRVKIEHTGDEPLRIPAGEHLKGS